MSLSETAPYGSADQIVKVLEKYRETGLGGAPVTTALLQKLQMGPEVARRVVLSLKLLELVDGEGSPTATLIAFEKAPSGEYKKVLANHLFDYYSPIFAVLGKDVSKWLPVQVEDQFREFVPKTLRERMAACFRGLCEYAEIIEPRSAPFKKRGPKTGEVARTSLQVRNHRKPDWTDFSVRLSPKSETALLKGASEAARLDLPSGGTLLVTFTGGVLELDPSDRQFVFQIFDQIKEFRNQLAHGTSRAKVEPNSDTPEGLKSILQ